MRIRASLLLPLVVLAAVACRNDNPTDSSSSDPVGKTKTILTSSEAQAAFAYVKSAGEGVDRAVPVNFSAPYTVTGATGSATVRGTKTSTSSSTSSSTTTTRTSNLSVTFNGFSAASSGPISGSATWYDYYYSRTACSISTCASASDHSESLKGSAVSVTFTYAGSTYSDRITIDGYSGADTVSWDVTITNQAGATFTFTYR